MYIQGHKTISSLVDNNTTSAKVLSRHGIDFFYDGDRSLQEACEEAGVDLDVILREINEPEIYRMEDRPDIATLEVDVLTDYIEAYHHRYTEENIQFIRISLSRLLTLYGSAHPELTELKEVFDELTSKIIVHMDHEKFIVYPYIRQLVQNDSAAQSPAFRSTGSPFEGMTHDHASRSLYLHRIHELTNDYTAPPGSGSAFRVTYAVMHELELDLYRHVTLEDEVLFPRALELERRRAQKSQSSYSS